MGLHLLNSLKVIMGSDSQALIKATENQCLHAGHYILDEIHNTAKKLQAKQDGLFNREEWAQVTREGEAWKGHTKGVINLCLIWVPGHHGFASNKHADEEVKKATQGGGEMVPVWLL